MKANSELRAEARARLKGNWLPGIGVCILYSILICVAGGLGGIPAIIVAGPLNLGLIGYFIRRARGEDAIVENLFYGFKNFGHSFLLYLLETIFICLWTLLFIIPGIIKSFSYAMSFYVLHDNPGMGALDAITASRKMMNGYKWKLFCLYFSFIGWCLLCGLTFGIGFLWLVPYMRQSVANFYEDVKAAPQS